MDTKDNKKAYLYAILACVLFGVTNFCASEVSIRVGMIGVFPQVPGLILTWVLYTMFNGIKFNSKMYYDRVDETEVFSMRRLAIPVGRSIFILLIHFTHTATFLFASKSNISGGIISTIFSSSCVFTFVIFYFKYG